MAIDVNAKQRPVNDPTFNPDIQPDKTIHDTSMAMAVLQINIIIKEANMMAPTPFFALGSVILTPVYFSHFF